MATPSLNILCFGDSLTSGYHCYGIGEHPYSIRLQARLSDALPGTNIQVFTNGDPGALASESLFRMRLQAELGKRPYDWVIILGGTNDIARSISPDKTFKALEGLWKLVLTKDSKVLALTIPECAVELDWLNAARDQVNHLIRTYEAPNFHSFDLKTHIPYHSLTEDEKKARWDDGLHLKPAGYDWMGDHIALALLPILRRDQQPDGAKPRTKKSAAHADDDLVFVEESGNPRNINEGYVVVRKKDLH